jgi:hypothetical protein
MTERKKRSQLMKTEFDESIARLIQTDPTALAQAMAAEAIKQREIANKQITESRREIEDGARPRKGRFRL